MIKDNERELATLKGKYRISWGGGWSHKRSLGRGVLPIEVFKP